MARWDYQQHGGVYRDVQDEGIERLIARRELNGADKVAYSGTDQWTSLADVPTFAAALSRAIGGPATDDARMSIPPVNNGNGARFYFVWFLITIGTSAYAFHQAASYNPEGNGMFNLVEASLSNQAWLQVVARLRNLAEINRAGHLAVIEELRRGR